jgi:hypothetical protein
MADFVADSPDSNIPATVAENDSQAAVTGAPAANTGADTSTEDNNIKDNSSGNNSSSASSGIAAVSNIQFGVDNNEHKVNIHYRHLTVEMLESALTADPHRLDEMYRLGPNSRINYDTSPGTPLLAAVKYGNLPVVRALVSRGADLNLAYEVRSDTQTFAISYNVDVITGTGDTSNSSMLVLQDRYRNVSDREWSGL